MHYLRNPGTSIVLLIAVFGFYACSSDSKTCDLTPCDVDCNGIVDQNCSISATIGAKNGGELRIDEGPLAGFSLVIPPGALREDTEVSLHVSPGESLQASPWDQTTDALLFADSWRTWEEIIEDWDKLQSWGPTFLMEWISHEGLGEATLTFDLQPSGLQFSTPARLTLPYQATTDGAVELWPALRVVQWSESEPTGRILTNSEVDPNASTISADILHFSQHQTMSGFADTLYDVGVRLGLAASLNSLPYLLLLDSVKGLGTPLTNAEISEKSADLAAEMLCEFQGDSIDYSVPDIDWRDLMGHLSTMPSLFNPYTDALPNFSTGYEYTLATAIRDEKGPVSFAKEFHLAMKLNGLNVFNSLMTMHNLGQGGHALNSEYESMAYLHPSITDLRGAHYHMAGLALLHMYTGGDYQSVLFGYIDEVGLSGAARGAFEVGELTANLIGSQLPSYFSSWSSHCDQLTSVSAFCVEESLLDGTKLTEEEAVVVYGTCNGFERSWYLTVDEAGTGTMPMVPDSCASLWLGALILTGAQLEWFYSEPTPATADSTSTDLGLFEIPGLWTIVHGEVFDGKIPPSPVAGASVAHQGEVVTADANGVFEFPERWLDCDPVVATAEFTGLTGYSEATDPVSSVTDVGIVTIHEPLSFNLNTVTRSFPGTRTTTIEGIYPVDPNNTNDPLATGTIEVIQEGGGAYTKTITNPNWNVDLVSTYTFSDSDDRAYTGQASLPFTLDASFNKSATLRVDVKIDNVLYGSLVLTSLRSSTRTASQPGVSEPYTSLGNTETSTAYALKRISAYSENSRQAVRFYITKHEVTETHTLAANHTYDREWVTVVTTYEQVLRTNESGVVVQATENSVSTTINRSENQMIFASGYMMLDEGSIDGLPATHSAATLNKTQTYEAGVSVLAP